MAKYDAKRRSTPPRTRNCGFLKHVMLVSVSFIAGYVCATFYDYTNLIRWVNVHVLMSAEPTSIKQPVQEAVLPKPKFEFYTLLTKDTATGAVVSTLPSVATASAEPVAREKSAATHAVPQLSIDTIASADSIKTTSLATALEAPQAVSTVGFSKDAYLVQLASFRRPQDADRMRASLTMKGFVVSVVGINQQNMRWYRVVLGPFSNKLDAQRAQSAIAKSERIAGMIRKVDV